MYSMTMTEIRGGRAIYNMRDMRETPEITPLYDAMRRFSNLFRTRNLRFMVVKLIRQANTQVTNQ
jgi:hypothetical protein